MTSRRVESLGAWTWISTIQFFIMQAVVQSAWTTPFSLSSNFISDLGNTACAPYPPGSASFVCSPWHPAMNASFIVTGLALAVGAVLLRDGLAPGRLVKAGLLLVAFAGCGFVLVGCYPENVNLAPHKLGAGLHFVLGNVGLVALGVGLSRVRRERALAVASMVLGPAGLLATAGLVSGHFAGFGVGGIERIAAYPLPIMVVPLGTRLLRGPRGST